MAVKNLSTRVAIIGRGAKCRGGSSAVDRSAYISRTIMYSEYDGTTYYPKYSEDLVHNEVMLPVNAPAEYLDPSVLWNSVEMNNYKINRINSGVDRKSKKMLAIISDILSEKLSKFLVDEIIEQIVEALNGK